LTNNLAEVCFRFSDNNPGARWRHRVLTENTKKQRSDNMRKMMQKVFMALSVLSMAVPAFAQAAGGGSSSGGGTGLAAIAAGIGMAIASGLCGIGQGLAVGPATGAVARNPGARPAIFLFLVLGLVFIESLALFTFAMIIIKVH
jgi:F-type H+-transporting ATPase subunit c